MICAAAATAAGQLSSPETLAEIVELARRQNYSDIHLGVGEQPRFRERGEIISSDWPTTEAYNSIVGSVRY